MKKLLFCLVLCVGAGAFGASVATVPVLHEGRIKPLDTFARVHLLSVYGKRSLPEMSALDWLVELMRDRETAFARPVFNLRNPDLVGHLGLEWREKHLYSFNEISAPLQKQEKSIGLLHQKQKEELTPVQRQLVDLYTASLSYLELAQSFSLVLPQFEITDPALASALKLEAGRHYNYMEMQTARPILENKIEKLRNKEPDLLNEKEWELARLGFSLERAAREEGSEILRLFPPQWHGGEGEWLSPWQSVRRGDGSPATADYLGLWRRYLANGEDGGLSAVALDLSKGLVSPWRLRWEVFYNRVDFFTKSLIFYLLGFLLLVGSWAVWPTRLRRLSFAAAGVGFLAHGAGLLMRIFIMGRPPVSTLYESILFVAFIAVLFGLILEKTRRNGFGLLTATTIGTILHFIGFSYAAEGDTMGMLVAVLNTNFWLATHVVTITIGYGCCFVGGILGHLYLVLRKLRPEARQKLKEIYRTSVGTALVALFFSLFGTILGGIWADQSWGRFWGWDPKENGALLIVLWLLFLLHGVLTKYLTQLGFALGMVVTNIMVALAWFGVNLLNVGLHSYGFTDSILFNLIAFCSAELVFGVGMYFWIRLRERES